MRNFNDFGSQVFVDLFLKKWKFHLISISVFAIIFLIVSLLLPNWYLSSSTLIPVKTSELGLGGISSAIKDFIPIRSKGGEDTDRFLSILYSETVLWEAINKFDLINAYEIDEYPRHNGLKRIKEYVNFDVTEQGNLIIEVWDQDSIQSMQMVEYFINKLNEVNTRLSIQEAENNLQYIESRLLEIENELKIAEDNLINYQKKSGVLEIEIQTEAILTGFAELQSQLIKTELEKSFIENLVGRDSKYEALNKQESFIKSKINDYLIGNGMANIEEFNIIHPINQLPDLGAEYYRLLREVEIKSKLLIFVTPIIEQFRLDTKKNIPSLLILDPPRVPEYKDKPKRALVIVAGTVSSYFLMLIIMILHYTYGQRINELIQLSKSI